MPLKFFGLWMGWRLFPSSATKKSESMSSVRLPIFILRFFPDAKARLKPSIFLSPSSFESRLLKNCLEVLLDMVSFLFSIQLN